MKSKARVHERRRIFLYVVAVFAAVAFICVFAFVKSYSVYNDKIIYEERLNQMQEVTKEQMKRMIQKLYDSFDENDRKELDLYADALRTQLRQEQES